MVRASPVFRRYAGWIGLLLLSRLILAALGVRFDASPLDWYFQFLDRPLLEHRLAESLWHLHAQPPGFNLAAGMALKLFPAHVAAVFHALFLLCSVAMLLLMMRLLRGFGLPERLTGPLALLFLLSPTAILHEHWLFYTWPVAALLLTAAAALQAYEAGRRTAAFAAYAAALTAVVWIRASYHGLFLALALALPLWRAAARTRQTLRIAGAALLVGLLPYMKNAAVFGAFSASSWSGMNLWRIVSQAADEGEIAGLVARGELPAAAAAPPFKALARYPAGYRTVPARFAGIPALAAPLKADGQTPNLNHIGYLRLAQDQGRAARSLALRHPGRYLRTVAAAAALYVKPAWDQPYLFRNARVLEPYTDAVTLAPPLYRLERALFGWPPDRRHPRALGLVYPAGVGLIGYGLWRRARRPAAARGGLGLALSFMLLTLGWNALTGIALEYGENNRFRVEADPLMWVAVCATACALRPRGAKGRQDRR